MGNSKTRFFITFFLYLILMWVFDIPYETVTGAILCTFLFWQLLLKINDALVFREIILIAFISQASLIPSYFYFYYEPIMEGAQYEVYIPTGYLNMSLACSIIFFIVFYLIPKKDYQKEKLDYVYTNIRNNESPHQLLIFVGIVSLLGLQLMIPGIAFIFKILSELLVVGLLYFSFKRKRKLLILLYLTAQLLYGLQFSMLGTFFITTFLFGVYYAFLYPFSKFKKVAIIFIGFSTLLLFQTVKHGYRFAKWYRQGELAHASSFTVWKTLIVDQLTSEDGLFNQHAISGLLGRLNQGYLSGLTFEHVPKNEPFANGETIGMAVASALVPRIFWPDKPEAGGQEMMKKYAGVTMINGTSMNIGIIGEAYVNFGIIGGVIFFFVFCFLLRLLYVKVLLRIATDKPHILLWFIPLLKPMIDLVGNDMLYTVNYLAKSFVVLLIVFHLVHSKFFKTLTKTLATTVTP
jgi:hypothetical protein